MNMFDKTFCLCLVAPWKYQYLKTFFFIILIELIGTLFSYKTSQFNKFCISEAGYYVMIFSSHTLFSIFYYFKINIIAKYY